MGRPAPCSAVSCCHPSHQQARPFTSSGKTLLILLRWLRQGKEHTARMDQTHSVQQRLPRRSAEGSTEASDPDTSTASLTPSSQYASRHPTRELQNRYAYHKVITVHATLFPLGDHIYTDLYLIANIKAMAMKHLTSPWLKTPDATGPRSAFRPGLLLHCIAAW